ncbi:uncharacterized protein LOC118462888 [Anopheles albimanus]|uniref:uncharacterized protein LOC118462888 n=1 Tax=Anopheles albimanus TaxID=7167 RepID=UPI00163E42AA|nr:uncharacterized protein LOC118462888 [Anopheles albimanus]
MAAREKWPEISSNTATSTIKLLRSLFARFGAPATLVSDKGTQFASAEFESFCSRKGIVHVRTPPYHPQCNGQAERFVDTCKRAVKKISTDGCSLSEALQEESKVARSFRPGDLIYAKVCSRNTWKWLAGTVSARVGRVIYKITTEDGGTLRRHVNQLRTRVQDVTRAAARSQPENLLLEAWFTEGNLSSPDTMLAPLAPPASISDTPTLPVAPTGSLQDESKI